jgi:hypothetical protein
MLMRVRSVIKDSKQSDCELVGEEMIFIGYRGAIDRHDFIPQEECRRLFFEAKASGNVDGAAQKVVFSKLTDWIANEASLRHNTDKIALERANRLVEAFAKYRTYVSSTEYQVVEPVLPMDVIAAYVFIPKLS